MTAFPGVAGEELEPIGNTDEAGGMGPVKAEGEPAVALRGGRAEELASPGSDDEAE